MHFFQELFESYNINIEVLKYPQNHDFENFKSFGKNYL